MAETEKLLEDESLGYQNGYDDDEGELGDGENSEDGTMIDDDVDGEGNDNGDFGTDNPEMYYDDENTDSPMKEITVRIEEGGLNSVKRGYDDTSDDVPVDPEKKRRRV